jgi:dihydrodipicolinate synthase/N-acetylneuraminate lyase
MIRHFSALADQATHPVMIYNIPYRTGVNLGNDAMLQLAEHPNIAGLKDCCAIRAQSVELQRRRPARFAVLTGEDAQTYDTLWQTARTAPFSRRRISKQMRLRRSSSCSHQATTMPRSGAGRPSLT